MSALRQQTNRWTIAHRRCATSGLSCLAFRWSRTRGIPLTAGAPGVRSMWREGTDFGGRLAQPGDRAGALLHAVGPHGVDDPAPRVEDERAVLAEQLRRVADQIVGGHVWRHAHGGAHGPPTA